MSTLSIQFQDGCHVKVHRDVLYVLDGVAKNTSLEP